MSINVCSFHGCGRTIRAKRLCAVHYNMMNRGEDLHEIGPQGGNRGSGGGKSIHVTCTLEGCDNKHRAKGYCSTHYNQLTAKGSVNLVAKRGRPREVGTCIVDGCEGPHCGRGYCRKHYMRLRSTGSLELIPGRHGGAKRKPKQPCDVDNCERFAICRGWCSKHYERFMKHGDPLTCCRRPRKSEYVSVDNILNSRGTYSLNADSEVLRDSFSDLNDIYDKYDEERILY